MKKKKFAEAFASLDTDLVMAAVGEGGYQDKNNLVMGWLDSASEEWVKKDYEGGGSIVAVEEEVRRKKGGGIPEVKGFIDLCIKTKDKQSLLVDWKSTSGVINDKWVARYKKSWQWRMYAWLKGATHFEYRGISPFPPYTKTIKFVVPENNGALVEEYLRGEYGCMEYLRLADVPVWPKNWAACEDFGRLCQYYGDCSTGNSPPRVPTKLVEISYTRMKTFGDCKEKYRRDKLVKEYEELGILTPAVESEVLENGKAFHRGIAEIYRQLFSL